MSEKPSLRIVSSAKREKRPNLGNPVLCARFMDAAKALGVVESEEAFEMAMYALLQLKPKPKR
jgi:hypothetical protein